MRMLLLLLVLGSSFAYAKQVYRWVDENGRVNYTEIPPADYKQPSINSQAVVTGSDAKDSNVTKSGTIPPTEQIGEQKEGSLQSTEEGKAQIPTQEAKEGEQVATAPVQVKKAVAYKAYVPTYSMLLDKDLMARVKLRKLPDPREMVAKEDEKQATPPTDEEKQQERQKACEDSKVNIEQIDSGLDLLTTNEDGTQRVMTEEEKTAAREYAEKSVAYFCDE